MTETTRKATRKAATKPTKKPAKPAARAAKTIEKAASPAARKASKPAAKLPVSTGRWLFKSEPDAFSWEQMKSRGGRGEPWTGVRNYLARNNMKVMKVGDLGFFYHSNEGKEIVGIVRVIAPAHPDPDDGTGTWECVDVEAVCDMPRPVTLADVKANRKLAAMSLVTSMRLSVQPVTRAEWAEVCRMGGLDPQAIEP